MRGLKMAVKTKDKRWQELEKGSIPLERLAQHFEGSGQWVEEPQRAVAFGFLYFLAQGFISRYLGDLLKRQDREPDSV
jgi:hypothetical protein